VSITKGVFTNQNSDKETYTYGDCGDSLENLLRLKLPHLFAFAVQTSNDKKKGKGLKEKAFSS
jgi:hypothetical protein